MHKRGAPYKKMGVANAQGLEQLIGAAAVPVLTAGWEKYEGLESSAYQSALDISGYPEISLL